MHVRESPNTSVQFLGFSSNEIRRRNKGKQLFMLFEFGHHFLFQAYPSFNSISWSVVYQTIAFLPEGFPTHTQMGLLHPKSTPYKGNLHQLVTRHMSTPHLEHFSFIAFRGSWSMMGPCGPSRHSSAASPSGVACPHGTRPPPQAAMPWLHRSKGCRRKTPAAAGPSAYASRRHAGPQLPLSTPSGPSYNTSRWAQTPPQPASAEKQWTHCDPLREGGPCWAHQTRPSLQIGSPWWWQWPGPSKGLSSVGRASASRMWGPPHHQPHGPLRPTHWWTQP